MRGDEDPVAVELKLLLNVGVLLQAVARLALPPKVYVGVPAHCKILKTRRKHIIKLFRMLGLGLLLIDPVRESDRVKVIRDPGEYQPRQSKPRKQRLLQEFNHRVGDPNRGASETRRGIMTAYR